MHTRIARVPETDEAPRKPYVPEFRPEWFAGKREKQLGKVVGLTQFGVNHVTLEPGARSALRHWHEAEDEFVLVLAGELTLIDEAGAHALPTGAFAGFPAGEPNGHHLANLSDAPAVYLAIGSRRPGEETVHYPDDPLGPVRK
ncbi:MAG TPA: cupin domain-containing protein [Phenylobacterium sp.]|nr:cupin domain-containing protein [Phenylobacterium sp.]